jgi:hypothetical protein
MGNDAAANDLNGLLPLLQRLDQLLEDAIAAAHLALAPETSATPYRDTHVTDADADRLLSREPGAPVFLGYGELPTDFPPELVPPGSRLAWLQQTFGLSNFDLDIVAIALAPELDRRYERLYIYLQDDVRARRPTVDLALNLLCANAATKLARRAHFAAEAPLIHHGLVHLVAEDSQSRVSLLAQELHLDDTVTRFLLGQPGLDRRLASSCQLIQPEAASQTLAWHSERVQSLTLLANQAQQTQTPLRLYFQGPDRSAKRHAAAAGDALRRPAEQRGVKGLGGIQFHIRQRDIAGQIRKGVAGHFDQRVHIAALVDPRIDRDRQKGAVVFVLAPGFGGQHHPVHPGIPAD